MEDADQAWLFIANASRGGFENTSPCLTGALLDKASDAIRATAGESVEDRFTRSFEVCRTFIQAHAGKEDYEIPAGSLSVVHIDDVAVQIRWLGGEEAWLVRGGRVDARALGHTMARRGEQTEVVGLGFGPSKDGESLRAPWGSGEPGHIVLLTRTVVEAVPEEEIIRCVTAGPVQDSADAVMEQFKMASHAAHGAIIVAERFGRKEPHL